MEFLFIFLLALVARVASAPSSYNSHGIEMPVARVRNGTYTGIYSPEYQQDFFLGIPYAQAPVGNLRFRNPQSLTTQWKDTRSATAYSKECVGYGASQMGYEVSEDCLYLNVIRPSGCEHESLPVAVWIHGGGFTQGGGVDLRYNLSFIVANSVAMGQPVIGVSINYRLSAWGFLQSKEVKESGHSNFGLRDQRLSLRWIQENIAAFGGNPEKVTIWGQSAGAASVGLHITAYNGRNDHLFRSAIMESGNPVFFGQQNRTSYYQLSYDNLTEQAGCNNAADSLQCLRQVPFANINAIINTTALSAIWLPQIDGDIIQRHSSQQIADGSFVHIPIILGANSDEGTSFSPLGMNNTQAFESSLLSLGMNTSFAQKILAAYPDDTAVEIIANLGPTFRPGPPQGTQYRRAATYYGDYMFIASRRLSCSTWAAAGLSAYCYRFNAIPAWARPLDGATHFVEVAFAMLNLEGVGYAPVRTPPFQGMPKSYTDLARLMSSDWVSFVAQGDPNAWKGRKGAGVPVWPEYSTREPKNFVFDANVTSYLECDTWRAEGINLINSGSLDVFDH